jgi:hypothetical protein
MESGIYEHEVQKSLKSNGFGADINANEDSNVYQFEAITLLQTKEIFLTFLLFNTFNILVLLMELIHFHYMDSLTNSPIISFIRRLFYFVFPLNTVNPNQSTIKIRLNKIYLN